MILEGQRQARLHLKFNDPWSHEWGPVHTICRRGPANGTRSSTPVLVHYPKWRAKPLVSYRVIVELISATTTKTGLTVRCELDNNPYSKAIVVSDDQMRSLNIQRADFHGEWKLHNNPINPTPQSG